MYTIESNNIYKKKIFLHNKFWTGNFIKAFKNLLRQGLGYCDNLMLSYNPEVWKILLNLFHDY